MCDHQFGKTAVSHAGLSRVQFQDIHAGDEGIQHVRALAHVFVIEECMAEQQPRERREQVGRGGVGSRAFKLENFGGWLEPAPRSRALDSCPVS